MRTILAVTAALLIGSPAFAAPNTLQTPSNMVAAAHMQTGQMLPLRPLCATGFAYSVKEQFGNPATGHLWFICGADVTCSGVISAGTQGTNTGFRFVYSCAIPQGPTPPQPLLCATGFVKGSISVAANIPGCMTPTISCPTNFAPMMHTATPAAGKHGAHFEYQCYRPGA